MSLYELMYHTFALSLSKVAARRVCLSSGTSASSMYSSTLKVQAVTVAIEVSFPSNLSGLVILIDSGIFDDCCDSEGVLGWDSVSDSVCLWSMSGSFGISVVMPRACNSLVRGILTVSDR